MGVGLDAMQPCVQVVRLRTYDSLLLFATSVLVLGRD
jgi:hypothetical protein